MNRKSHGRARDRFSGDLAFGEAKSRIEIARKAKAISLDLSRLGLAVLPDELWDLSSLEDLSLNHNRLKALPHKISRLMRLTKLNFDFNNLESLPESIGSLIHLVSLNVTNNRLTTFPRSIGRLAALQHLDLSCNRLVSLPDALGDLRSLVQLDVTKNQLRVLPRLSGCYRLSTLFISFNSLGAIPDWISVLSDLKYLSASSAQIHKVPDSLYLLKNLELLALCDNPLAELPPGIERLRSLRGLNLSVSPSVILWSSQKMLWTENATQKGYLRTLPKDLKNVPSLRELYLHGQTLLGLPPEVIGPSWTEVHGQSTAIPPTNPATLLDYYYRTFGEGANSQPLNEAKMILVGRGGVGKTSLVNRLVHSRFSSAESKTDGISITPWKLRFGKEVREEIRLNIWDFGGQEVMHSTHQFFMTKRSLYLLVLNAREGEQDPNIEYWLRLIESFGSDSPIIIVINKVGDHTFDLNRRGLREKFPTIREFVQTDCASEIGIADLRKAIVRETDRLEHLRDLFPTAWFAVKDRLANLREHENKDFIPFTRYQELCVGYGIEDPLGQETLVGFLHDLGIVVNFRDDPRLAEMHVLNPEWVTNGIYKILNAETLARKRGEISLSDLAGVLDRHSYPQNMHMFLLDLMRKFELCYEFYDSLGHYLVPELLGKEEPDLTDFQAKDALRFEYRYNIVPEGLLPRFIVRSRALNRSLARWRTGVLLEWERNTAMVKADPQDRHVSISVVGPLDGRRRLLAVLRADLEHIHRSIPKLQPKGEVPVPGHQGLALDYETLSVLESEGETQYSVVHEGRLIKVPLRDLLRGVEEPRTARDSARGSKTQDGIRLAFSYSHRDEELRDELETHLKLMQRQGFVALWHDRKLSPGDSWKDVIENNFVQADLVLLLVSADFLASDYCYEVEMKTVIQRWKDGAARVVPVVVRACNWQDSILGELQALPKDHPVTSWPNRDEAWNDVAHGIRKCVDEIRSGRVA